MNFHSRNFALIASTILFSQSAYAVIDPAAGSVAKPTKSAIAQQQTDQLIIKFKPAKGKLLAANITQAQSAVTALGQQAGVELNLVRPMSGQAYVVKLNRKMSDKELSKVITELEKDPNILYVEPDRINKPFTTPNDPGYNDQWHYHTPTQSPGGANLPGAWDITTGGSGQVVAVIDTGILPHADLTGKTVQGYDFISDSTIGNDSDGRDADATDAGDWCYEGDDCYNPSRGNANSSWHGTHVAGTIAAATNNGSGVAGINWNAKILPVRVLGKGGGYTSDIIDGVRWAAGLSVSEVDDNANPAKVLNLSLGGGYPCDSTWQSAINDITAAGAIMVVAAGNSNDDAANYSPASCENVITVAATSGEGGRSYYSNYGSTVELAAPGGDYNVDTTILSTLDGGATTALNDNTYAQYQGTSMASPHVAGIVSLMTDVNGSLTYSDVLNLLVNTARSFPSRTSNDCSLGDCGAGIIDARAAVTAARDGLPKPTITAINDFSNNGYNDLVWHNYLTGGVKIWNMSAANSLGEMQILSSSNTNLVVKAFADFNNDGKPDIVLHNSVSGMVRIWLMNGTTRLSNELVLESSNTNLHIIGAGDFTGDGNVDIAVHNSDTGALRIWEMDGNLERTANISAIASSNTNLQGVAVGDLNADGKPDVLLHNSATGNVRAWLMDGTVKASNELVANSSNTNLKVRGILDIDADGKDDILWQNRSTGVVLLWKMDGTVKDGSNIQLGSVSDLSWDVGAGTGGELTVTNVTLGSTTPAYLEAGTSDWFKVTVSSSGTLTIKTLSDIDTYGHLYDIYLNQIEEADDINFDGGNYNFRIIQSVGTGTYYIQVHGWNYAPEISGNYSLKLWMD